MNKPSFVPFKKTMAVVLSVAFAGIAPVAFANHPELGQKNAEVVEKIDGQWEPGSLAGEWKLKTKDGYWVTNKRVKINGAIYAFDKLSQMQTGWVLFSDGWRYFASNGAQVNGWYKEGNSWYYLHPLTGVMSTGEQVINGTHYVFNDNGSLKTGWVKIESGAWTYFDKDGNLVHGWLKDGGYWYYLAPSTGFMVIGPQQINKIRYHFDSTGAMATGWVEYEDAWRFFGENGGLATGWNNIHGAWYYLTPVTGDMYQKAWLTLDGGITNYYFGDTGAMATGWVKFGNEGWRYFDNSGNMQIGWAQLDGHKYFFDNLTGFMVPGKTH